MILSVLSWMCSSRLALASRSWRRLPAASPVKVAMLMRTVMVLTMCHSDKLLYNDALANLVTSFINRDRVHYVRLAQHFNWRQF